MKDQELLTAVRRLLNDPWNWTRCSYARTADGRECLPHDVEATRWCIAGAAIRVGDQDSDFRISKLLAPFTAPRHLVPMVDGVKMPCIARFNDDETTTHSDVLAILDAAILGGPTLEHVMEILETVKHDA